MSDPPGEVTQLFHNWAGGYGAARERAGHTLQPTALVNVVEMRVFGGFTVNEVADAVGASPATVKREWSIARAWLRREFGRSQPRAEA